MLNVNLTFNLRRVSTHAPAFDVRRHRQNLTLGRLTLVVFDHVCFHARDSVRVTVVVVERVVERVAKCAARSPA